MTTELRKFYAAYCEAPSEFRARIDEAYQAVRTVFMSYGWPLSNTDSAEELIAAIVKYTVVSRDTQLNG